MTVPADTAMCYLAGQVFALAGAGAIKEGGEGEEACLNRARAFTAAVTVPVGGYFLLRWPEWSWMYLAGDRARSPLLAAGGLSAYMVANEAGFRLAARYLRKGRRWRAVLHLAGSSVAVGVLGLAGLPRLRWLGTLREYRLGLASDIFGDLDFQLSMAGAGVLVAPLALLALKKNLEQGRA